MRSAASSSAACGPRASRSTPAPTERLGSGRRSTAATRRSCSTCCCPGMNGYSVCDAPASGGQHHTDPRAHGQERRVRPDRPARLRRRRLPHQAGQHRRHRCPAAGAHPPQLARSRRTRSCAANCTTTLAFASARSPTPRWRSPAGRTSCCAGCSWPTARVSTGRNCSTTCGDPTSGVDASNLDIYLRRLREKLAPVAGRERAWRRLPDRREMTNPFVGRPGAGSPSPCSPSPRCCTRCSGTIGFVQIANSGRDAIRDRIEEVLDDLEDAAPCRHRDSRASRRPMA